MTVSTRRVADALLVEDLFDEPAGLFDDEGPSVYSQIEQQDLTGNSRSKTQIIEPSRPTKPALQEHATKDPAGKTKKTKQKKEHQVQNTVFDQAMERLKSKRRRTEISDQDASDRVQNLLQNMRDAYDTDVEHLRHGQPAVAKLQLIETVVREVSKPVLNPHFMADGFLEACALWLQPQVEGHLANFTIRRQLLALLSKAHITPERMTGIGLGERLVQMWNHPEETEANRKLIRKIVMMVANPLLSRQK
ncbi:putative IWS1-like protein [Gregarina niphandrodes]|uniref:IWS1-like protein n=1 Tax=Gregarina niphandrodes TaxID=110365 RepID=A0A023B5M7_GRENI|nr:putative IWS1-like protein [Gregarina niphandrodes]EZG61153.1 putative IWS1-like protein [Gregarina niphandrodes]|eukprot:XP_011130806.1 putative IWS1-like protein [Gregarina niphandrodes]